MSLSQGQPVAAFTFDITGLCDLQPAYGIIIGGPGQPVEIFIPGIFFLFSAMQHPNNISG